ncbi:MAG: peptidoglycan DD-metalloendopeptidase family protein [Alphaproteobacteria bacterium]|nr:peptidoglycan DD-metalloendopeptidase family protein [Alphaproteobacteria bacterium]
MTGSFNLLSSYSVWRTIAGGALAAALAVGAGWAFSEGAIVGPSAAELEARRAAQEAIDLQTQHAAFTGAFQSQEARAVSVQRGQTLASILVDAGASPAEAQAALVSMGAVFDPRLIRPGQEIQLSFEHAGGGAQLCGIAFRSQPGATVVVSRGAEGAYAAREVLMPLTFEIARISAAVEGSLYDSALRLGATSREVEALADAFAFDVDFQRDVRPGDGFELVFERFYDEDGATVRTGDLLFLALETRRGPREFYRFQAPGDRNADWYDGDGKSARKFLMKTPINGARLSSGFGMRRHPILGFSRLHQGTDFAARSGTPVMAAGEGTVVRAGWFGTYGNYVRIRHTDGYETAYAHLSRIPRGVRPGVGVRQTQVIGYVGTTGRSTGPHLHYEVIYRGRAMNPMSLRVPTGRNLSGRDLELFQMERDRIDRLRRARDAQEEAALRAGALRSASLRGSLRDT